LFDILKQHQNKVNEIHAEKITSNANPLALVDAAQHYLDKYSPDTYYQSPKPHKTHTSSSRHTTSTSSHKTTRNKSKEIAKPVTPPSESASEEDNDPKQAKKDKDMQKNLALIAKKPKRAKDYEYHKEKMMLCKQESKGILLSAEQEDWLHDTNYEPDEQELEAHYTYMAKIREVPTADSGPTYDSEPLEKVHSNVDYNVLAIDKQHPEQPKSINDTYVVETVYSNVTLDSLDMIIKDRLTKLLKNPRMNMCCLLCKIRFANPLYLKKAQKVKPCLYNVKYNKNDLVNLFAPESDETIRLVEGSRSKLCKTT
ncbi:hypothetical protein Tco_1432688, partial [Tanacetum coccineum]